MKLLHVITSLDPKLGGPIEGLRNLAQEIIHQGHIAEVLTLDPVSSSWLADFPVKVHTVGKSFLKYRYAPKLLQWLNSNNHNYDAIILHGIWQYGSFGTWLALRNSNTPYFIFTHGMLDPWFKSHYPLKHLKKKLYWLLAENRVLRDAKAVLFTCEDERLLARQSFEPYQCNELVVGYSASEPIGNPGLQLKHFYDVYPELRGKQLFLFLSRIHQKKGCDLLIKAFGMYTQSHPDLHLVMAGPDLNGWQNELMTLARQLGIEKRITWTGMITGDLKWGAYHAADSFILPSHSENFGIVVAEALACGLPVLISNKVNIWREIEQDSAGFVENDDHDGTSSLINKWLALNEEQKKIMRIQARACFEKRYRIESFATNFLGKTQDCLDN